MRIKRPLDDLFGNSQDIRVLRHMILYPTKVMTGRGLARELGMNHVTCLKALNALNDAGLVDRSTVGTSFTYELARDSIMIREMLAPLFQKEKVLLELLIEAIIKGSKRQLNSVVVFGSVARGEDTLESDVDLLLVLKPGADREKLESVVDENTAEAYKLFRIGVNALIYDHDKFEEMKASGHRLAKEILADGLKYL